MNAFTCVYQYILLKKTHQLFISDYSTLWGFPGGSVGKESTCDAGEDLGSIPGLGRSPGAGHGSPLQCSCLENGHRQRSLVGYRPWDCKELDMTERLRTRTRHVPRD